MTTKKIPMRSCVVTREKLPKKELLRIVKFENVVSVDPTGKQNGKGCYIKKDKTVLETAKNTKVLNKDYIEYRYSYRKTIRRKVGKVWTHRRVTRYSWTSDPNHSNLTGETRLCHYVYQACNVYIDEHGKYVVIPSEEVDDIRDLVGEYTYVRKVYYKIINLENNLELDYEDGPDCDEELKNEEAVTQSYNDINIEYAEGPKLTKSY